MNDQDQQYRGQGQQANQQQQEQEQQQQEVSAHQGAEAAQQAYLQVCPNQYAGSGTGLQVEWGGPADPDDIIFMVRQDLYHGDPNAVADDLITTVRIGDKKPSRVAGGQDVCVVIKGYYHGDPRKDPKKEATEEKNVSTLLLEQRAAACHCNHQR